MLDDGAAEERPDDSCEAPHRTEHPLHSRALFHLEQIADHRHGHRLHRAGAEALQCAKRDELVDRLGGATRDGPHQEKHDAEHEDRLASVEVGELAVHRHRHRGRQHVGGEHPRVEPDPSELTDHRGHGGRHHGHLHRRHEQRCEESNDRRGAVRPFGCCFHVPERAPRSARSTASQQGSTRTGQSSDPAGYCTVVITLSVLSDGFESVWVVDTVAENQS